jgi:hypothetical protein
MKKHLIYILSFALPGCISLNAKAQLTFSLKEKFIKDASKSLYSEHFLKTPPLLTGTKTKNIVCDKRPDIYLLTSGKMPCALPNTQIKYHIKVFNPETTLNYSADNIPNALHKIDLINKTLPK